MERSVHILKKTIREDLCHVDPRTHRHLNGYSLHEQKQSDAETNLAYIIDANARRRFH